MATVQPITQTTPSFKRLRNPIKVGREIEQEIESIKAQDIPNSRKKMLIFNAKGNNNFSMNCYSLYKSAKQLGNQIIDFFKK